MTTTIAISEAVREQIKEYGHKGETYDQILVRLIEAANNYALEKLLMDDTNCSPISEAIDRAKKKWRS